MMMSSATVIEAEEVVDCVVHSDPVEMASRLQDANTFDPGICTRDGNKKTKQIMTFFN